MLIGDQRASVAGRADPPIQADAVIIVVKSDFARPNIRGFATFGSSSRLLLWRDRMLGMIVRGLGQSIDACNYHRKGKS